jgi:superfamily II DNA or RNA helicase
MDPFIQVLASQPPSFIHQLDAYQHLSSNEDSGMVNMFCGTGKTITFGSILTKYNKSCIFVPNLNLAKQHLIDLVESGKNFGAFPIVNKEFSNRHILVVGSDRTMKNSVKKEIIVSTTPKIIKDFFNKDGKKLVICLFQSSAKLLQVMKKNNFNFDCSILDEGHGTTTDNKSYFYDKDNEYHSLLGRKLTFTATITEEMTEEKYGNILFEYNMSDAIENKTIKDYQVIIPIYGGNIEDENDEFHERIRINNLLQTIAINKISGMILFHRYSDCKDEVYTSANSYLKSMETIFYEEKAKLEGKYDYLRGKKFQFDNVSGSENKETTKRIKHFESRDENTIAFLSNCRVLGEGTDIKKVHGVAFIDPKNSVRDIIQNIGRAMRIDNTYDYPATIFVPVFINTDKVEEEVGDVEDIDVKIDNKITKEAFKRVLSVLGALKENDKELLLELQHSSCRNKPHPKPTTTGDGVVKNNGDGGVGDNDVGDDGDGGVENNGDGGVGDNDVGDVGDSDDGAGVGGNDDSDSDDGAGVGGNDDSDDDDSDSHNEDDVGGNVKFKNNVPKKKKVHYYIDDTLLKCWHINTTDLKQHIDNQVDVMITKWISGENEVRWFENLKQVKKFMNDNGRRPNEKKEGEKYLGSWVSNQLKYRKNNQYSMADENRREAWDDFVNDDKYREYFMTDEDEWFENLKQVKKFIDDNGRRPYPHKEEVKGEKSLGKWVSYQITNRKNNQYCMADEKRRVAWDKFVENNKELFMSNEEEWFETLENVKKFIEKNKKRPLEKSEIKEEKTLGSWISNQLKNRKKYENNNEDGHSMKNETIRDAWDKFIENNKELFMSNEEEWFETLENVKKYIEKNKKKPSQHSKTATNEEKTLGNWVSDQLKNRKKYEANNGDGKAMKNETIRDTWDAFVKDDKYREYFCDLYEHRAIKKWRTHINTAKEICDKKGLDYKTYKPTQRIKIGSDINNYRNAMKGLGRCKVYDSVTKMVNDIFPEWFNVETIILTKSVKISPKRQSQTTNKGEYNNSQYQELNQRMMIQRSTTTKQMFEDNQQLWEAYHKCRDESFKGYKEQERIPVNMVIREIEKIGDRKLKILDLGCGRNKIREHFKGTKIDITGYDHVSYNGSVVCDISKLPEEDESIDICVLSHSLMGSNKREYIEEAKRVLRYRGYLMIADNIKLYEEVKEIVKDMKTEEEYKRDDEKYFLIKLSKE